MSTIWGYGIVPSSAPGAAIRPDLYPEVDIDIIEG
jgi:hypothetical protein